MERSGTQPLTDVPSWPTAATTVSAGSSASQAGNAASLSGPTVLPAAAASRTDASGGSQGVWQQIKVGFSG